MSSNSDIKLLQENEEISLACDASSVSVGAVIFYTLSDGKEEVIAYGSQKLSQAEEKLCSDSKIDMHCMACRSSDSTFWEEDFVWLLSTNLYL